MWHLTSAGVPFDFQLTRTVQIESRSKLACYAEMQPVLAVVS